MLLSDKILLGICANFVIRFYNTAIIGLYRTSRTVRKSGKFLKSVLSKNRTFSLPDAGIFFKKRKNRKELKEQKI